MQRNFLTCLEIWNLPNFAEGCYVLVGIHLQMLMQIVLNSTLSFTSCFHKASTTSQQWELRAFSGSSWACAQLYTCVWPSRSQEYRDISFPSFSFWVFCYHCLRYLWCLKIILMIFNKKTHWWFSTNVPEGKALHTMWALRSNKDKPCEWNFPGNCQPIR